MASKPAKPTAPVITDTEAGTADGELVSALPGAPPKPTRTEPDTKWKHHELWSQVLALLEALPSYFKSDLTISGVLATDLFAFNSSLGATIEEQVVGSLNRLRDAWDPKKEYANYAFVRRPQRFPDVTLQKADPTGDEGILMGIELKGWYVLAKEREPSFRYQVTPAACAPADLIAIFPWALDNVVSGSPRIFAPYLENARFVAEYRNWHWEWKRASKAKKDGTMPPRGVALSTITVPYPQLKSDEISDKAEYDGGGNFGRIARTNLTRDYIEGIDGVGGLMRQTLAGIPLWAWQEFFKPFAETASEGSLKAAIQHIAAKLAAQRAPGAESTAHMTENLLALARTLLGAEE